MRLDFKVLVRAFKPLLIADGYFEDVIDRWIDVCIPVVGFVRAY